MSLQVSALNLFKRALNTPAKALLMTRRAIAECDEKADGPVGRARQLLKSPVYGPCMQSILDHKPLPPTWQHDLRQRFRLATWQSLVSDRPQDFSGAFAGIQEKLSALLLLSWSAEADELQFLLDSNLVSEPPATQDPRPRLKILRLLICGGLMDPERDARHRKKPGTVYCKCNQPINFDHITWQCPLTADLRAPAIAVLSDTVESLPLGFRRATLVPQTFQKDKFSLHIVQTSLVNIWQKHILDWSETEEPATFAPPVTDNAESNLRQPVERNGHIIKPIPNAEGVFCVRCGMQTKLVKHLRLKISRKKCTQANVSSDKWLSRPGHLTSKNRLDDAERQLNEQFNRGRHTLTWNRLLGKDPNSPDKLGRLWCSRCKRSWLWANRQNNLPRTKCDTSRQREPTPDWVKSFAIASAVPLRRLRQKTSQQVIVARNARDQAIVIPDLPASSSELPRAGVG